jgi:hypothetical protein
MGVKLRNAPLFCAKLNFIQFLLPFPFFLNTSINVTFVFIVLTCIRKKSHVYKNQGHEPIHQNYKVNDSTSRHNPKKKMKTNNQQKIGKRKPFATRTQGYEMMINDNKEDLR